jgi:hypothetical protein
MVCSAVSNYEPTRGTKKGHGRRPSCSRTFTGGEVQPVDPSWMAARIGVQVLGSTVTIDEPLIANQDMYTSYQATAVPQSIGKSGHRGFCTDEAGEIKADLADGTNYSQAIQ